MSSWDIKKAKESRVMISTICPPDGKVTYEWAKAWRELQLPEGSDSQIIQALPYGVARNFAVKRTLEQGFSYLFFLDSDIILPSNSVVRLIETKIPLISCYYTHRYPPYKHCFYGARKNEEGKYEQTAITEWNFGDIVPVVFLPAGACLIHCSVFEKMLQAGIKKPYEWTLDIDNPTGVSEDFAFSMRAVGIGIQPYVHTGIQAKHEVIATCGVRGIEAVTQ